MLTVIEPMPNVTVDQCGNETIIIASNFWGMHITFGQAKLSNGLVSAATEESVRLRS